MDKDRATEPAAPAEPAAPTREPPDGPADLLAAGTLCWRPTRGGAGVEVLLVHRPRYDDWSWPKGKPARGEALTECAVRETEEETGVEVVLGRPLPPVRYRLPDGSIKEVSYWAARPVTERRGPHDPGEVDRATWLPLDVAAERLTMPGDAAPLAALAEYAEQGTLATTEVLIIRHATARPRDAWARSEASRPLVASGRRQAMALGALLHCWRPEFLLSSPWRRCVATMGPYTAATGVRLRTKNGLSEEGYRRRPRKAGQHTRTLLESAHGGGLCTHRPVLPGVLAVIREASDPEIQSQIPDSNPYLRPGEVLVAHVSRNHGHPRIVAIERHGTR
ncbi:MAG TPA: NUDIX domain-containing protein [Kineosporiaceae bacterium]|nr:NUDIX domain-containing protein [Kineosporiaceae bacterium]